MKKAITYVLAATITLVAAGGVWYQYCLRTSFAGHQRSVEVVNRRDMPAALRTDSLSESKNEISVASEVQRSEARVTEDTLHDAHSLATAQRESALDGSVVGQAFPVSESIEAQCTAMQSLGRSSTCHEAHELLAMFKREPRDEIWAPRIEAALRSHVANQSGYAIRNLECRTSVCAVEASSTDTKWPISNYEFLSTNGLRHMTNMHGSEVDADGKQIHVIAQIFTKR